MSYRVLARAYRSPSFDDVVGQEAIATTLKNAITSGRVHHGYLFTGTRGVGKTSMARILAKALNCLSSSAATTTPCCTCDVCTAVAEGQDVDVVEIDAASHTGVDDIRELRSNAAFRPTRSRFKVYIVDEVHMLSTSAFNALLKTLEEPPAHVKFILATTEIQKVPATIQSRCQRFDFRAIEPEVITGQLRRILEAEKITADEAVLRRIARLANGSMRDALSLLDKLLSYAGDSLTVAVMEELVPPPHDELAAVVANALGEGDAAAALRGFEIALQHGRTIDRFCEDLITHVRTLMLLRVCGAETELVDASAAMRPALAEQAAKFDAPTYVYMIALLEELRRHVKFNGAARALADAAMVRLATARQFTELGPILARLEGDATAGAAPLIEAAKKKELIPVRERDARRAAGFSPRDETAPERVAERVLPDSSRDLSTREGAPPTRGDATLVEGDDAMIGDTATIEPASAASPSRLGSGFDGVTSQVGSEAADTRSRIVPDTGSVIREASRADWDRVARDPFIQRVKEAVEGTLFDVTPIMTTPKEDPLPVSAEGIEDTPEPDLVMPEEES